MDSQQGIPLNNNNLDNNNKDNDNNNNTATASISNLSNALRSVNLGNSNTTTDQSNIDFVSIGQQQQNQINTNINNNTTINTNTNSAINQSANNNHINSINNTDVISNPKSMNNNILSSSGSFVNRNIINRHSSGNRVIQNQQGNNINNDNLQNAYTYLGGSQIDNSRILKFFENPPLEGFTLFSHRSAPNGFKVAIVLSELGLPYNTYFLDFNKGEHRCPEFININPNARVPALIDHNNDNLSIWESGSIILYLVNQYLKISGGNPLLWADNLADQSCITSWLFFQTSGHAPMIGQALHFKYFHSTKVPSAIERYTDEVRRVYGVVEMALAEKREALIMDLDTENAAAYSAGTTPMSQSRFFDYPVWLVGDKITIADLSFVPWNNVVDRIGINIKVEFPEVYKWTKHMMRRPAVIKALRGE
ncbi:glutathione peroxidase SCDLUD_003032 [Saccharomycodes ludwigii]|uniref:glutathione peroxidase n=1 Tax=Saccharomycodes ludwigii TaxID=36035 RepID=UPI001E8A1DF7|nr:hypothetical protein SCDLUD_003032 [Saccharomycodes ludwigii]KAH3901535.1 hypothetical protein SCDLUD_003032 [Saccharomycodes ludwigii]